MSRWKFARICLAASFVIVTGSVFGARASTERPNVIVIMADDLGWMDLHCQGNPHLDTPNIDGLAAAGMRFTDAYAAAPVCTPTRAAVMTGQAPARLAITNHAPGHGANFSLPGDNLVEADWNTYLALDHVTIAETLRSAGYATGFIGKWHLSHRRGKDEQGPYEPRLRPEHQGFELNVGGCGFGGPPSYFEPYRIPNITPRKDGDYLPERLADEAIQFVKSNRHKRFFLTWWPCPGSAASRSCARTSTGSGCVATVPGPQVRPTNGSR